MKKIILALLIALPSLAFSEIVRCDNLNEAKAHIKEDSTLFCEVDDVFVTGTTVASKQSYFDHLRDELLAEGYDPDQIENMLYPRWVDVQQIAEVVPSGVEVLDFVDWINARAEPTYILTYRGPRLSYETLDQLHAKGIYLKHSTTPNHLFEDHLSTFFEGMLFVHPICNKGDYLLKFLKFFNKKPKHIVCIDSCLINLVDLQEALEPTGIEFTGVYLRRLQQPLSDWDKKVGALQMQYLEEILPNEIAKHLVD